MTIDRWDFVKQFQESLKEEWYKVIVDDQPFCELGFPVEESYASIIDTCSCLVESDEKFRGRLVKQAYMNVDDGLVYLYTKKEEWWTL